MKKSNEQDYTRFWGISIYDWCHYTALLHLCISIVFVILSITLHVNNIQFTTTKQVGVWLRASTLPVDNTSAISQVLDTNKCPLANTSNTYSSQYVIKQIVLQGPGLIDTRILIILFHFISFVFQYAECFDKATYLNTLNKGQISVSHFIEYSVSASLMTIALCAQLGITDVFLICSIAANVCGCMIFGALAELLFDNHVILLVTTGLSTYTLEAHWIAHFAGWLVLVFALASVVSNTLTITNCTLVSSNIAVPTWVSGIVWSEVCLFGNFGLVQLLSFIYRGNQPENRVKWAYYTEMAYVALSITAKSILGFGIIFGNFINSSSSP